ncbi:hypothetical protein GCM10009779_20500 [Polymorphospora rubra]
MGLIDSTVPPAGRSPRQVRTTTHPSDADVTDSKYQKQRWHAKPRATYRRVSTFALLTGLRQKSINLSTPHTLCDELIHRQ